MPRPLYPATLIAKHQLSQNTVQLNFSIEAGFDYQPGQFVQLHFSFQGQDYKRSYSIANSPESFRNSQQIEIAISFVKGGVASALFSEAEPRLELSIGGPFGVLTAPEQYDGRIILAGTGTGVAPYRAMIPALEKLAAKGTRILIMMGVRHRADMIYEQDFRNLAASFEAIEYRACYSREKSLTPSANEYPGYLQNQFPQLNLSPEKDLVYLCGNPAMIDDASGELKELGFGARQVKREKYVFSS